MLRISNGILLRAAVVGVFFVAAASAAVMGDLNLGTGGTVSAQLGMLTFNFDPSSNPPGPPWNMEVATGTNLTFDGGPAAVTAAVFVFSPLTIMTPLPLNNFITFQAFPSLFFSLTQIGPGSSNTNCAGVVNVGDSCSVFAGGQTVLTLGPNNTTFAAFGVQGKASDTGIAGLATGSNYQGSFSTPLTALLPDGTAPTPANIQHFFCPSLPCQPSDFMSGKTITTPFSAQITVTAIPEPQIPALVLGGLLVLLGRVGMRRFNRSR
jgi:hypothetical protein